MTHASLAPQVRPGRPLLHMTADEGLLTAALWAGFSLLGATQTYVSMLAHGHSYLRILLCQSAIWALWALLTPALLLLARRFPLSPWSARSLGVHALCALLLSLAHVAACVAITIWLRPYDAMSPRHFARSFRQSLPYNLQLELLLYGAIVGAAHARAYYQRYRERERDAGVLAAELTRARLHALELQLRPHFLFNTLHSIGGLVRLNRNREAVAMIVRLSDLLRHCLDGEEVQRVPLSQELDLFDKYIDIERVRFSDRLSVEVSAPDPVRAALVPRFILQPLAENAVRHGLCRGAGAARLVLSVWRDGDRLRIDLFNSGPGIGADAGSGIGLRNTETRLRQLYGADGTIELREVEGGVTAAVTLPFAAARPEVAP